MEATVLGDRVTGGPPVACHTTPTTPRALHHCTTTYYTTIYYTRVNGLKDGVSNEWFATFDLATPAAARGQKPSVVIDRPVLQQILLDQVGSICSLVITPISRPYLGAAADPSRPGAA